MNASVKILENKLIKENKDPNGTLIYFISRYSRGC